MECGSPIRLNARRLDSEHVLADLCGREFATRIRALGAIFGHFISLGAFARPLLDLPLNRRLRWDLYTILDSRHFPGSHTACTSHDY